MRLFDLHCDTLSEMYRKNESFKSNTCAISADKALPLFSEYRQVMAIFSDQAKTPEENYKICNEILDMAEHELYGTDGFTPILAVEGGRLLCGRLERLDELAKRNIKILTLVWQGESSMGGAFDNGRGLTPFGKSAVRRCFEVGIVPDASHGNDKIAYEALEIANEYKKPIIASHSYALSVCPHKRNISDDVARRIAEGGGIIGVSLVTCHLGGYEISDIVKNIEHLTDICGKNAVCLGCDFDGIDEAHLPEKIKNVGDLPILYDALSKKHHSEAFADEIFYTNARNFFKNGYL